MRIGARHRAVSELKYAKSTRRSERDSKAPEKRALARTLRREAKAICRSGD